MTILSRITRHVQDNPAHGALGAMVSACAQVLYFGSIAACLAHELIVCAIVLAMVSGDQDPPCLA